MLFKDIPIGAFFFLPGQDDICRKTTDETAVDNSCAPGWCFDPGPNTKCDKAIRKEAAEEQS